MNNVNKARYFIKKAAVHSYLRSMLRGIKLEKVAQTQTRTFRGSFSPEEVQEILGDDKFNGTTAEEYKQWRMQRMRKLHDAAINKTNQNQQGNAAENSIRARPLEGKRNTLTTLNDNLAQADRQISEAAQQAQQRIRPAQKPDPTQGRYAQSAQRPQPRQPRQPRQTPQFNQSAQRPQPRQVPQFNQTPQFNQSAQRPQPRQVPQVPINRPPIRRGHQGGTSWR